MLLHLYLALIDHLEKIALWDWNLDSIFPNWLGTKLGPPPHLVSKVYHKHLYGDPPCKSHPIESEGAIMVTVGSPSSSRLGIHLCFRDTTWSAGLGGIRIH